jgi:hypothetical protein
MGLLWMRQWSQIRKRRVIHRNSARPSILWDMTFSHSCWWRLCPVDWSIYLHLQGQQSKMKALRSTETSVTLHQSIGHNLHQQLCETVMSHRIEGRAELRCMTRLLRICEYHCRIHKSPIQDIFSFRALRYIKTAVNTNKCTILQSLSSSYNM